MSGSRHSKADHQRIRSARAKAKEIDTIMAELGDDDYTEDESSAKSVSFEERCSQVRYEIERVMGMANIWGWVEFTYPEYAVVNIGGQYYRVNYQVSVDGIVSVAPISDWLKVEREWMAPGMKALAQKATPPAVKALDSYRVKGKGVVFGGKDLMGDTFTKETDYGEARSFVGMPVYYDHAMGGLKSQIGEVKAYEFADDALIFEVEIDRRKKYAETVMQLANQQALGMSTGAVAHLVYGEKGVMKRWVIGEVSLTPIPAEPRTNADPLKSLLSQADPQVPGEGASDAATADDILIILD